MSGPQFDTPEVLAAYRAVEALHNGVIADLRAERDMLRAALEEIAALPAPWQQPKTRTWRGIAQEALTSQPGYPPHEDNAEPAPSVTGGLDEAAETWTNATNTRGIQWPPDTDRG